MIYNIKLTGVTLASFMDHKNNCRIDGGQLASPTTPQLPQNL